MLYEYIDDGCIIVKYERDTDDYRLLHTVNPDMYEANPTYSDMVAIIYYSMLDCVDEDYENYYPYVAFNIINHKSNSINAYVIPDSVFDFFNGEWVLLVSEGE
jgi:hypothetical protein